MRVVVMEKLHHSILLKEASVGNKDEFRSVSREQPKASGRYYVIPIVSTTTTCLHLHQRIDERKNSVIGRHVQERLTQRRTGQD